MRDWQHQDRLITPTIITTQDYLQAVEIINHWTGWRLANSPHKKQLQIMLDTQWNIKRQYLANHNTINQWE